MSVWLLLWTVLDAYLDLGICGLILEYSELFSAGVGMASMKFYLISTVVATHMDIDFNI